MHVPEGLCLHVHPVNMSSVGQYVDTCVTDVCVCMCVYPCPSVYPRVYLCPSVYPRVYLCQSVYPRVYLCPSVYPRVYLCPSVYPCVLKCSPVCKRRRRSVIRRRGRGTLRSYPVPAAENTSQTPRRLQRSIRRSGTDPLIAPLHKKTETVIYKSLIIYH
jgi:hypothetical protein